MYNTSCCLYPNYLILYSLFFSPKNSFQYVWCGQGWKLRHSSCLVRLTYSIIVFSSRFQVPLLMIWRTVYFSSRSEDDLFLVKRRRMKFFERHVRHMRAADGKPIQTFPPPYTLFEFFGHFH